MSQNYRKKKKIIKKGIFSAFFFSRKFIILNGSYIPHFETENIVVMANDVINSYDLKTVCEIGGGTGVIGISIKKENPGCNLTVFEKERKKWFNCCINSKLHKTKINFIKQDFFKSETKKYDLIVSNPPYIKTKEAKKIVKSKTKLHNLDGGKSGINFTINILKKCQSRFIILELGYIEHIYLLEKKIFFGWKLKKYIKPIENQNVFFCLLVNQKKI